MSKDQIEQINEQLDRINELGISADIVQGMKYYARGVADESERRDRQEANENAQSS